MGWKAAGLEAHTVWRLSLSEQINSYRMSPQEEEPEGPVLLLACVAREGEVLDVSVCKQTGEQLDRQANLSLLSIHVSWV